MCLANTDRTWRLLEALEILKRAIDRAERDVSIAAREIDKLREEHNSSQIYPGPEGISRT